MFFLFFFIFEGLGFFEIVGLLVGGLVFFILGELGIFWFGVWAF